jgi:hypothetical protein
MKIEEKNICKFKSMLNTFSIDENFKRGGGFWSRISERKKIQITIHGKQYLPFLRISQITVNQ